MTSKRLSIWAAITATMATASVLLGTNHYSIQEALNALVNGTDGNLHQYSTQEAANLLVELAQTPTERDTLVSEICLVMDDNVKRGSGSAGTYENMDTMRAAMFSCRTAVNGTTVYTDADGRTTKWHFPVTFTIEPQSALAQGGSDTSSAATSTNFSIYDFNNFATRYGCDLTCTTGFDEQGGWAHGITGKIAKGNFTSYDQFENNLIRGIKPSMIDSLGFRNIDPNFKFKTMSWSNASATMPQKQILARNGIKYAVSSNNLASANSTQGVRPNFLWPISGGVPMGLGEGANNFISCMPGRLPDRYEIVQALAETNDTTIVMDTIRKCVALRGSGLVINIHNLALWSSNLTGTTGPGTVSGLMAILAKYERQGRIKFVTFDQFCNDFYERPIGPTANWLPKNFSDNDLDGKVDLFIQGVTGNSFPGTSATGVPTNGTGAVTITTGGYGGLKEAALRWEGISAIGAHGSVAGQVFDPEFNNARTQPWSSGALAVAYPCPPQGYMAHIEFEVREDTTKCSLARHGGDGGTNDGVPHGTTAANSGGVGDTIGVWWQASAGGRWNKKQLGLSVQPLYILSETASRKWMPYGSYATTVTTEKEVLMVLTNKDRNSSTANKYARFEAEFPVPAMADILYIGIWKGGSIQSQAVRISDVSLSFYRANYFEGQ